MIIKFFYKHGPYPLGALSTTHCPGVGSHYRKNTGLVFWARTRPNKSFCCSPLLSCKSLFSESRRGGGGGGLRVAEGWEARDTELERAVVHSASTDVGAWPPGILCKPDWGLGITTHACPSGMPAAGKGTQTESPQLLPGDKHRMGTVQESNAIGLKPT